ncbi:MAG TPA: peroxiredoxin-like family protein [Kofleriaceae bacterium]|nr:peroxiredoxin-like family protein [Kofleriaceae bacterium]
MHQQIASIRDVGAELFVIGNGAPSFIAGFRETTKYDGPIYTDPSRAVFGAAKLKRGIAKTFNPLALGKTVGAFIRGQRQGRMQGDPWQQGGTLVIDRDGTVRWHHTSGRPGDNAEAAQIVAALRTPG